MLMLIMRMEKRMFAGARTMLVVYGILVMVTGNLPLISAQTRCGDVYTFTTRCRTYLRQSGGMSPPSPQCCEALENTDVKCLCQYFGIFRLFFSIEKFVYVLDQCQMPLASGTKCGGYTVP